MWKLSTLSTAKPWTSAGYLKAAKGPFRNTFRNMVDDPDDLLKLDYDHVVSEWDQWRSNFEQFHPDLTDQQKARLEKQLNNLKAELKSTLELGAVVPRGAVFAESIT